MAVTYIWIYIICNDFICKAKIKNLLPMVASIALGVINGVMLGSRGEAIQLVVAVIVTYLFLLKKYNGWQSGLKFRQIFLIAVILLALAFGFKASGDLLGRNSVIHYSTSAMDEVAKYLGAEIKNLDIYLEAPFEKAEMTGSQTFGIILSWINAKFHLGWNVKTVLPFQKVDEISLGNVYTVFYAYIYDFGYIGFVILTALFAVLVQLIYEYAPLEKRTQKINFMIILNSYTLFLVAFSFFGERFFAAVLNTSFVKYILIWKFMIWFVTKLKVKNREYSLRTGSTSPEILHADKKSEHN
jgi:oligosaccharide repeat unit polymerase